MARSKRASGSLRRFVRAFTGLQREETISGSVFLIPNFVGFCAFTLFPIAFALALTFTNWDLSKSRQFIGLGNYVRLVQDRLFWKTLGNSMYYTFVAVPTGVFAAFCLALLMNRKMKGVILFRTLYFLPQVTLVVATALIWNWIYHPELGLLNYFLRRLGIPGQNWLHSTTWAMPAVIVMSNWQGIAPAILILLAGLQGIPQEFYEAAEIDGANSLNRLLYVTIPLLSPTIFFVVVTSLIGALQAFSQFYIMTGGGPAYATAPLVLYIYQNGFEWFNMGYGATLAAVLFIVILIITLIQWKVARTWVYGFAE
jgi:multiple sugar transport system permease protein